MAPHRPTRRLGADPLSAHASANRRVRRLDREPVASQGDPGVLTFLSQVLIGDSEWSLAEVRQLVALRERARFDHS
jgi:hypothetical protein